MERVVERVVTREVPVEVPVDRVVYQVTSERHGEAVRQRLVIAPSLRGRRPS